MEDISMFNKKPMSKNGNDLKPYPEKKKFKKINQYLYNLRKTLELFYMLNCVILKNLIILNTILTFIIFFIINLDFSLYIMFINM